MKCKDDKPDVTPPDQPDNDKPDCPTALWLQTLALKSLRIYRVSHLKERRFEHENHTFSMR